MKKIYSYWIGHEDDESTTYYGTRKEALDALFERLKELDMCKDEGYLEIGLQEAEWGIAQAILYSETDKEAPMQPLIIDEHGTVRFKENPIVNFLLEAGPFNLNQIWCLPNVSIESMEQFYQLIGYSVSGFGEMSKFREKTISDADLAAKELRDAKDIDRGYDEG
jgi:hypothetical protein